MLSHFSLTAIDFQGVCERSPRSVVANILDCDMVESKFDL